MWQPLLLIFSGIILLVFSFILRNYRPSIFFTLFIAFVVRLIFVLLFPSVHSFDKLAVESNADLTLRGISIYPEHAYLHYPYFPVFIYILALAGYLSQFLVPHMVTVKIFIILFDLGIVYLLSRMGKHYRPNIALLYALSPIAILVTSFHGQFDSMALFFILMALILNQQKKESYSIIALGTAIALKTWPAILVFTFFQRLRNKWNVLWIALVPAISVVVYTSIFKATIWDIIHPILNYSGVQQPLWGISFAIHQLFGEVDPILLQSLHQVFLFMLSVYILFFSKKQTLEKTILRILLFFFAFTIHSGIQWFLWLIPFLLLVRPRGWWPLYILVTTFAITHYASWVEIDMSPSTKMTHLLIRNLTTEITWIVIFIIISIQHRLHRPTN